MQQRVLKFYTHPVIAWGVAVIIVVNFLINIVEKEIDPIASKYPGTWARFELAFNIIFLLELLINMYSLGGPFKPFWSSGWNVFDTIIVTVGVVLMTDTDLGPFNKLKLLRAFRIFRLFKRIKSLNKILVAIAGSLRGVANALAIMLIFMCIYAILAVDLFHGFGSMDGTYMTSDIVPMLDGSDLLLNTSVTSLTSRGMHHFSEYYGTFFRALYTLFQVMTGESWSEACARPLLFGLEQNNGVQVGVFYISYIMIMQFVMMNVVVAVLLMGMDPGGGDPTTAADYYTYDHSTDEHMLDGEDGDPAASALAPSPSAPPQGPPLLVASPAAAAAAAAPSTAELEGQGKARQVNPEPVNAEPSDAELAVRVEQTLDAILFELGIMQKDAATQGVELKTLMREQSGGWVASERGLGAGAGLVTHAGPDRSKPNSTLEMTTRPRLNLAPVEAHQPEASLLESSQRFLSELVQPILHPIGISRDASSRDASSQDADDKSATISATCKSAAALSSDSELAGASSATTINGIASQPSTRTPTCSVRNRHPRTNLGTNRSSGLPVKTVQV